MSSIASIQIVDFVLQKLYEGNSPLGMEDGAIYGALVKEFRELDGSPYAINKLLSTLKTLERENLIYSEMRVSKLIETPKKHYFLSLDGELLIERGGYGEKLKDLSQDKKRTNRQWWFNIGIGILSVVTVIVAVADYFKKDEIHLLQPQITQKVQLGKHLIVIDTSLKNRDSLLKKK